MFCYRVNVSWKEASQQCKKYGGYLPQPKTKPLIPEGSQKLISLVFKGLRADREFLEQLGDIVYIGLTKMVSLG